MLVALLLLSAPSGVPGILGQTPAVVAKRLGAGKVVSRTTFDYCPVRNVRYGATTVEYWADRARDVTVVFPSAPKLDWRQALDRCGYRGRKVTVKANGKRDSVEDWSISGLPNGATAVYTRRPNEQSLLVSAPVAAITSVSLAERKAILDAVRKPTERELKQPVRFVVSHLRSADGWALLLGRPVQPNGKDIDYRKTRFRDAIDNGVFDDGLVALLRRSGKAWQLRQLVIGPTDVPWDGWWDQYRIPKIVFPLEGQSE